MRERFLDDCAQHADRQNEIGIVTNRRSLFRSAAKFLQALAALLPGSGVEDADSRQVVNFEADDQLRPEHDPAQIVASFWDALPARLRDV
jgi:hypothetical protein